MWVAETHYCLLTDLEIANQIQTCWDNVKRALGTVCVLP